MQFARLKLLVKFLQISYILTISKNISKFTDIDDHNKSSNQVNYSVMHVIRARFLAAKICSCHARFKPSYQLKWDKIKILINVTLSLTITGFPLYLTRQIL